MRSFALLSALAGLAATAAASDVLDLTSKTFASTVDPEDLILVEFFAPWCGHCKALAPEYEIAATELKEKSIKLAKVDCTVEADLCGEFGVQGYPTLKVFEKGTPKDYNGPRKADGIVSFLTKRSLPAVSIVTGDNHTEFIKADKVVVVAYLESTDTANLALFSAYANEHRDDYLFGVAHDEASHTAVGAPAYPAIILHKSFDEGRNDYTGEITNHGLSEFIQKHSVPLFDEISPSTFAMYAESGLPLAYTFIEASDTNREALVKSLEPVAKAHQGAINFVWIDAVKFADHAKSLNLVEPKWPAFAIQNIQMQEKFPLEQSKTVDLETVKKFVEDFVAGKIEASVKSADIPKAQDEPVYVLVADEFEKVVYGENNDKDVFIEFYAPWCGHCKKLKPIWDTLGERFADSKDKLVVAKFDATENDIPSVAGFRVQGFPTIKFKPSGSKDFIDYEGDRSLEDMVTFVETHSVHKVKAAEASPEKETEQVVSEDKEEAGHDEL